MKKKARTDTISSMSAEGFIKIDMHVHTRHSDGLSKTEKLIKRARHKGIGFAITDHNTILGVIEAFKLKNKKDIIIPGIELHAKEGPHFLIYFKSIADAKRFYKKHVEKNVGADPLSRTNLSIEDIAAFAKEKNLLVALAHPTARLWANIENVLGKRKIKNSILEKFHAAEVLSGHQPKRINKKALLLSIKYGLGKIGGSDAHSAMELGSILTIAHVDNINEFLDAIRSKNTIVVGEETKVYRKAVSQANIVRQHLRYARPFLKGKVKVRMSRIKDGKDRFMEKINKLKRKTKRQK